MDADTSLRIARPEFARVYKRLRRTHRPVKARLSSSHLAKIGRVVVKFQRLEFTLSRVLTDLFRMNMAQGQILASELPFCRMVSLFAALTAFWEVQSDDASVLLQAMTDAECVRNRIMHSMWAGGSEPLVGAVRIKLKAHAKKGLAETFETLSVKDLARIASWIDRVDSALEAFRFQLLTRLPAPSA